MAEQSNKDSRSAATKSKSDLAAAYDYSQQQPQQSIPPPISTTTTRSRQQSSASSVKSFSSTGRRPQSPVSSNKSKIPAFYNVQVSSAPVFLRRTSIKPPAVNTLWSKRLTQLLPPEKRFENVLQQQPSGGTSKRSTDSLEKPPVAPPLVVNSTQASPLPPPVVVVEKTAAVATSPTPQIIVNSSPVHYIHVKEVSTSTPDIEGFPAHTRRKIIFDEATQTSFVDEKPVAVVAKDPPPAPLVSIQVWPLDTFFFSFL